jgi:hypothetical protein
MSNYEDIRTMLRAYLPNGVITGAKRLTDLLHALEQEGVIGVGNYHVLIRVLDDVGLREHLEEIDKCASTIRMILQDNDHDNDHVQSGRASRPITGDVSRPINGDGHFPQSVPRKSTNNMLSFEMYNFQFISLNLCFNLNYLLYYRKENCYLNENVLNCQCICRYN